MQKVKKATGQPEKSIKNFKIDDTFEWVYDIEGVLSNNDLIVTARDETALQWFGSTTKQFLTHRGNSELSSIFGRYIENEEEFCYQLGRTIPSHQTPKRAEELFDTMLRNVTRPQTRYFIWYDADVLYHKDAALFKKLVWTMNLATQKQDYLKANQSVDIVQRNLFLGLNFSPEDFVEIASFDPSFPDYMKDVEQFKCELISLEYNNKK